jgi:uncharacterized repeat protein (TIGR01451 family)
MNEKTMRGESILRKALRALGRRRARDRAVGTALLLAGLLTATLAKAEPLRIEWMSDGSPSHTGSGYGITVRNTGLAAVTDVRLHPAAGLWIDCDPLTAANADFRSQRQLAAGDRVSCEVRWQQPPVRSVSGGAILLTARDGEGRGIQQTLGFMEGVSTPGQGIGVLLAGAIHQDADFDGLLEVGDTIAYHYTVMNLGTLALSGVSVTDLVGAVPCAGALAPGASVTCTRTYAVTVADQSNGLVINDVRLTAMDSGGGPVAGGDIIATLNLAARAGIRVFKSPLLLNDADGSGFASLGDRLRYTFAVKNGNAENLSAVNLVEPDPTRIDTPITCAASTLGGAGYAGNGTGVLSSFDTVLCSAEYTIRQTDVDFGQALNLVEARAQAPIAGAVLGTGASAVVIPGNFVITVVKTANLVVVFQGGQVTYTVTVSNPGTLPVSNVTINDPLPVGVASFQWTCAGAACPNAAGTGAIAELIPVLPAGQQVVYTVIATLEPGAPPSVVNAVTVGPPGPVLCVPGNTPPPCSSTVPIAVAPVPNRVDALEGSRAVLLAIAMLLLGLAVLRRQD